MTHEGVDDHWVESIDVMVTIRIDCKPDPARFEGWQGRTPETLAEYAAFIGGSRDLSNLDGYADCIGRAVITEAEVWP